ncbi:MAG TPA: hypothetical protein VGK02_06285 [Candidatus Aquicultor sp.]
MKRFAKPIHELVPAPHNTSQERLAIGELRKKISGVKADVEKVKASQGIEKK